VWTALSSGDGLEENNGGDDNNASAPQAGLSQEASGSHGPLSTPLESPSQSPLLTSASLTESGVTGLAGSSQTFHYTFDLNGNVSEVLDSTGTIAAHYEYGPFGEVTHEFHSSNSHLSLLTFNFSTKYHDSETGLLYYGFRYYDPSTGRWLNRDPIAEQGGVNLYGFVGNDGVNSWDLLGMVLNVMPFPTSKSGNDEMIFLAEESLSKIRNSKDHDGNSTEFALMLKEIEDSQIVVNMYLWWDDCGRVERSNRTTDALSGYPSELTIKMGMSGQDIDIGNGDSIPFDMNSRFVHELAHALGYVRGESYYKMTLTVMQDEICATQMENRWRKYSGLRQRPNYSPEPEVYWPVQMYD